MAGASTALCSRAIYSSPSYLYQPAPDCLLPQPPSISRLCLSMRPRRRLHMHLSSSSASFQKAPFFLNGWKLKSSLLHRDLWFSLSASSEDSPSVSFKGPESDSAGEDSSKPASDLSKFLEQPQDVSYAGVSKATDSKPASDLSKFLEQPQDVSYAGVSQATDSKPASDLSKFLEQPQDVSNAGVSEATDKDTVSGKDGVSGKEGASEAVAKEESNESAKKFIGVLRDTTEELREQAEKARAVLAATAQETAAVLAATAQETAEKSKENLSYIAENAPDPIREIADTALKAHSADTPKRFAKIHDFCLGIPYGSTLVIGGLLWFIISGSTAAIRFGVILGGILLGLSVTSLSAWKEEKPTKTYVIGQAVISAILAFRQIRRLSEVKSFFPAAFFTLISAGMLGFFCYVLLAGGNPPKRKQHAPAA